MDIQRNRLMNEIKEQFSRQKALKQTSIDEELVERNILLIGRRRCGKTTLVQMLDDPTEVGEMSDLLPLVTASHCKRIECKQSTVHINVVDTLGVSYSESVEEQLQEIHQYCITRKINGFHLICFCTSIESGILPQDVKIIEGIQKVFGQNINSNLCMIIMRSELKTENQRQRLWTQITNSSPFSPIIHLFEKGIYFAGCLNYDNWYQSHNILKIQFDNVCNLRDKLLILIQSTTTQCQLSESIRRRRPHSPSSPLPLPPNEIASNRDENGRFPDHSKPL